MGPINPPPCPVRYKERPGTPFTRTQKVVEVILPDGDSKEFAADTWADAIARAGEAGYKL